MASQIFINAVRSRKSSSKKHLKKPPKWLFPHSVEREYTKDLYSCVFSIRESINAILIPQLPNLIAQATMTYPTRNDDFLDTLEQLLASIRIRLSPKIEETKDKSKGVARRIALFNQAQFQKTIDHVLGIDIFLNQPWLSTQLELFASQNAELIESLADQELERVSGIVQRGLQEGSTYNAIAKTIQKSFGITRRRAKLIARDQTTKLNGSLTKLRQQEVGIEEYMWQTSGDERVRADHRVLDGMICSWNDPTIYKVPGEAKWRKRSQIGATLVHTSQDVNCRCVSIPRIEGILE